MSDDFAYMSALDLRRLIRSKEVSPVEIVESTLRRVEALQPVLNPFVTITADLALGAAKRAE
jgi:aspartyl-tRNA(Asn)/glutamyl-tRNA(Gln) amidotransferase subunit A